MEFPQAIYFDTNALREAGDFLTQGAMTRLIEQALDLSIPLHVPEIVWGERIAQLKARLRSNIETARGVSRLVGSVEVVPPELLDEKKLTQMSVLCSVICSVTQGTMCQIPSETL